MVFFSGCKINLGLKVLKKLDNGYHSLSTIIIPVPFPFHDVIEINLHSSFEFKISGLDIPNTSINDNICVKAYRLVKALYPSLPNVKILLLKNIPVGSGLGAGSANGVTVLKGLATSFDIDLSQKEILEMSKKLGSDCPFFVYDTPCYVEHTGDKISPIDILELKGKYLLLVFPNISISTAKAFQHLNLNSLERKKLTLSNIHRLETWKQHFINDFEEIIFKQHPSLLEIKKQLYKTGAIYASMSGTGSTMYGIYHSYPDAKFLKSFGKAIVVRF